MFHFCACDVFEAGLKLWVLLGFSVIVLLCIALVFRYRYSVVSEKLMPAMNAAKTNETAVTKKDAGTCS